MIIVLVFVLVVANFRSRNARPLNTNAEAFDYQETHWKSRSLGRVLGKYNRFGSREL